MLNKGDNQMYTTIYVEKGKEQWIDIMYESRELLDYGGDPCNTDNTYQMDECYTKETEKTSLATVGCTTPYTSNKTNICTDANKGLAALNIYNKFMFYTSKNYEGCYHPCSYLIVSSKEFLSHSTYFMFSNITIYFPQVIQETKTQYTYSGLSLIAEIGGYVGLFLGISINQITNLLEFLVLRIRSLFTF